MPAKIIAGLKMVKVNLRVRVCLILDFKSFYILTSLYDMSFHMSKKLLDT